MGAEPCGAYQALGGGTEMMIVGQQSRFPSSHRDGFADVRGTQCPIG